jgi:flagellar motor switch protein FliN/FliY
MPDAEKPSQSKPEKGSSEISRSELDALLKKGSPAKKVKPAGPSQEAAKAAQGINEADIDALLAQAAPSQTPMRAEKPDTFTFEPVQPQAPAAEKPGVDLLMDVGLNVRVELGRRKMFIEDILKLTKGSVVELDKLAGDPLDILVNDKLVAQGEVLVLNDNFCIRITSILAPGEKKE